MKFKEWDGEPLEGWWDFTIKIDGIQVKRLARGLYVSKNGNPLNHMQKVNKTFEIAEVFRKSWGESWSVVSASKSKRIPIENHEVYTILPKIDKRLYLGRFKDPASEKIKELFNCTVEAGYEGLVLRQEGIFIKVKTVYTKDVRITGYVEGKGKFIGMLGKITTDEGDCGTGYTNAEREDIWERQEELLGKFVEIESMEATSNGKLRNPRFVRLRLDK